MQNMISSSICNPPPTIGTALVLLPWDKIHKSPHHIRTPHVRSSAERRSFGGLTTLEAKKILGFFWDCASAWASIGWVPGARLTKGKNAGLSVLFLKKEKKRTQAKQNRTKKSSIVLCLSAKETPRRGRCPSETNPSIFFFLSSVMCLCK